jgi:hypothetical protein
MSHRIGFQSLDFECPSHLAEREDVFLWLTSINIFVIALHDMPAICGCWCG